jgi:hypothetical protein
MNLRLACAWLERLVTMAGLAWLAWIAIGT